MPGARWPARAVPLLVVVALLAGFALGTPLARAKFTGKTMNTGSTWVASAHFYYDAIAATSPAPWGYWHFDETAGTTATAAIGGRNGSFNATYVTRNVAGATSDGGKAFRFANNVPNSRVQIANSASFILGNVFTAEAWVKSNNTGIIRTIMGKGDGTLSFEITTTNRIQLARNNYGIIATATAGWADTNWHHTAVTKNGATVKLYLDGVDVTGTVTNQTMVDSGSWPLEIGNDGLGQTPMVGDIDEPALYTSALTATQIQRHYDQR